MRLPNGYGSVVKLGGRRRRPYAVKVTTGWTAEGRQVQRYLSYHAKRADALRALAEYHDRPFSLDARRLTVAELYERWAAKEGTVKNCYKAAWSRLNTVRDMAVADVRRRHIQADVDACPLGYSSCKNLKTLCNKLFTLAVDLELVTANPATGVALPPNVQSSVHRPFDDAELAKLWAAADSPAGADRRGARLALVLSYTGLRPTELLRIRTENVDLEARTMRGGMKTAAGKNRVVPIARKILPFVAEWLDPGQEYLVLSHRDGRPMLTYDRLRSHVWERTPLLAGHLPHDGRHTCATMLSNAGVDLKTTQLILGHRSTSVTLAVYTHRTLAQLLAAVDKL